MSETNRNEATDSNQSGLSRRKWLQLTAAGSAGALAGCSGGGGDDTTSTTTTSSGGGGGDETTEDTTTTTTTQGYLDVPFRYPRGQANLLEPEMAPFASGYHYEYYTLFQGKGGRFTLTWNDFIWMDWDGEPELDEGAGELRFSIKDGLKWHSGQEGVIDDFSAKDLAFDEQLGRLMVPESERTEDPAVTGWHADGDDTFVLELNTDTGYNDQQIVNNYTQDYSFDIYRKGIYEGKLQAIREASSKDEKDKIRTEVTQMTAAIDDKPLCGPWQIENAAQQQITFNLDKDHWIAKNNNINWDTLVVKSVTGEGNVGYAACRQDQLDWCGIPGTVADPPSYLKTIINASGAGFGQGFIVPYSSPADPVFWEDPQVAAYTRQAIAFATDKKQVGKNQMSVPDNANRPPKAKFMDKTHLLQSTAMAKDTLGDDYSKFPDYKQDQEKAASRLRSAGFTKDGGTWYKPDGDKFSFEIQAFGWTTKAGQTMTSQLDSMGIDISVVKMNASQMVGKYWGQNEYTTTIAESTPHSGPPSSFMSYWWDPAGSTILAPGSEDRDADWSKYPVPPIGQMDAEPTQEVDTRKLVDKFEVSKESEIQEDVKLLSWVSAYHLPCYPMYLQPDEDGISGRHFEWPEPAPSFDSFGGNYGLATAAHNAVHGAAKHHHYLRGIGKGWGSPDGSTEGTSMLAKKE